jgi:hypothetical protein
LAHKSNSDRPAHLVALERGAIVVLGLYLAGVGLNAITSGDSMYSNYLRWPVVAPIAVVIGVILIIGGLVLHR